MKKKHKLPSLFSPSLKSVFISIKTSLTSILKNYDLNFPIINNLVFECNDIVIRTYQFIRLFLLFKYTHNQPLIDINKLNILYFIRAGGIRDNRGVKSKNIEFQNELNNFYENEFAPLINKEKYNLKNKSYIIPYLAIQIETGFNNNIKEHFITRIRRFMNIIKPDDIDHNEFNRIKNLILLDKMDIISEKYKEWSNYIKDNFLPTSVSTSVVISSRVLDYIKTSSCISFADDIPHFYGIDPSLNFIV